MAILPPRIRSLFIRHAARTLFHSGKILHRLWLEVTGAIFLALAIMAAPSILRQWRAYQEGASVLQLLAVIFFTVMMVSFGVYSFWKARRYR